MKRMFGSLGLGVVIALSHTPVAFSKPEVVDLTKITCTEMLAKDSDGYFNFNCRERKEITLLTFGHILGNGNYSSKVGLDLSDRITDNITDIICALPNIDPAITLRDALIKYFTTKDVLTK